MRPSTGAASTAQIAPVAGMFLTSTNLTSTLRTMAVTPFVPRVESRMMASMRSRER